MEGKKNTEIRKEGDRVVAHVCVNLMERTDISNQYRRIKQGGNKGWREHSGSRKSGTQH